MLGSLSVVWWIGSVNYWRLYDTCNIALMLDVAEIWIQRSLLGCLHRLHFQFHGLTGILGIGFMPPAFFTHEDQRRQEIKCLLARKTDACKDQVQLTVIGGQSVKCFCLHASLELQAANFVRFQLGKSLLFTVHIYWFQSLTCSEAHIPRNELGLVNGS